MAKLTQEHRSIGLASPLGDDVLLLRRMEGREEMSRLFEYELDLLSEDTGINFNDILGQNVTVRVERSDGETRYFNGYVSRFSHLPEPGDMAHYRATLVPWLWFLTRTSDCRIFQEMTVPDIVKQVFRDLGFTDFSESLSGTYRTWEYCVQYRETAFDFVSRLMEHEGIYYYFKHENGKHTLVLSDSISSHETVGGYEEVPYYPPNQQHREAECISSWAVEHRVQPGEVALNDYDFKAPKKALLTKSIAQRDHAGSNLPLFDYPGSYTVVGDGEAYAAVRLEERQARYEVVNAGGDTRGLTTGCLFTLRDCARADQDREYLVTSARYTIQSDQFGSSGGGADEPLFTMAFTAIASAQQYRPARLTPKPVVQGPQTAVVVGKSGEEIWTDEHGRVKVMFHWDRYAAADEKSSCWVRVSQNWAGKKWGAFFLPRIGQEVIVDFLEGDPDQPIITGRVYNGDNVPPYPLPEKQTISTIKSNSSKGGGGFNEIRFEDKKGEEQVFIHAEKNQDVRVKNDCFEWIGNNRHLTVKKDQLEKVENDRHEEVVRDHVEKIGRDFNLKVEGKQAIHIVGSHSITVDDDVIQVYKKKHSQEVTEDCYIKAKNICIEATENITIKVGDSFIAIESGGIKIGTNGDIVLEAQGNISQKATGDVKIEATGNLDGKSTGNTKLEATANMEIKGTAMAKLESSGAVTVKGSATQVG